MSTLEMRYMGVINLTCNEPGRHMKRDLARRFKLSEDAVDWLIKLLRLDAKGYKTKLKKELIAYYIINNPLSTAEDVSKATGAHIGHVYAAARQNGLTMQNAYSLRRIVNIKK